MVSLSLHSTRETVLIAASTLSWLGLNPWSWICDAGVTHIITYQKYHVYNHKHVRADHQRQSPDSSSSLSLLSLNP